MQTTILHLDDGKGKPICKAEDKNNIISWDKQPTCPKCSMIHRLTKERANTELKTNEIDIIYNGDENTPLCTASKVLGCIQFSPIPVEYDQIVFKN